MKWIIKKAKNLYKLYIIGAKANDFPISKYGFMGEKYRKP